MSAPDGDRSQAALPAKVGVYVCHCGQNIAAKVDVERVVAFAASLPGVAVARDYKFMCSDPGQDLIQQDIRDGLVNRVVVASCSPLMHGATFRRATEAGGISPFYSQMASIREHVSWVTADSGDATEKANALVAGAVRRVAAHEQLDRRRAPVHPDVLVVGGGIAGIHAALTLADAGKHVYLVEREPCIGGQMAKFDKTFPTLDCAACILTPKMVQVGQHPNIDLLVLQRGGGGLRLCGQLQGQGAQEGPLHQRGRLHRLQSVRRELHLGRDPVGVRLRPRHPPGRLQAVPAGRAGPARSSTARAPRGAPSAARPASRPTATCHSSGRASTRRRSTSCSTRRPWSGAWAGPATRSARRSAPGRAWRARCRSGG